jgi:hypothetical protein
MVSNGIFLDGILAPQVSLYTTLYWLDEYADEPLTKPIEMWVEHRSAEGNQPRP